MRPIIASSGMKLMDYWRESLSSTNSSEETAVSTTSIKIGLELALDYCWEGMMYSNVV